MRKGSPKKRVLLPDPKYKDILVTQFVNNLMKEGKKSLAFRIFYNAIDKVGEKTGGVGFEIWKKALDNVVPVVEVKRRRVGGSTVQVPVEIRPTRRLSLGIKWLITQARLRSENTMEDKLVYEIIAASQGEGKSVKKRTDVHKMAESNKAFSHFKF